MTSSLIEPILLHNNTMETHSNMKTLRHCDMEGTLYIHGNVETIFVNQQ